MSEQEEIQRQIATLRQDLAAAQNESVRAFIQQQLDAAQRQLNVLLKDVSAPQSNLAIGNSVGGDLVQTITIQQFFAGQPAPDGDRRLLVVGRRRRVAGGPQPQRPARLTDGQGERPVVGRRHQVDRHPHERPLDDRPLLEQPGEVVAAEPLDPRPQADVHRRRVLGLQAAHQLQRPGDTDPGPL